MASDLSYDHEMMEYALAEARKCNPKPTAFCVGCILVTRFESLPPTIIARGYSRELEGNTHAEANALTKARNLSKDQIYNLFPTAGDENLSIDEILRSTDVYTTMEPCSVRSTGLAPCADALIAAKIPRCVIGVGEPDDFVHCEGARKLIDAGVHVVWLRGMEDQCLNEARRGHASQP